MRRREEEGREEEGGGNERSRREKEEKGKIGELGTERAIPYTPGLGSPLYANFRPSSSSSTPPPPQLGNLDQSFLRQAYIFVSYKKKGTIYLVRLSL